MDYKYENLKGQKVAVKCLNSEEWEEVKRIIGNPAGLEDYSLYRSGNGNIGIATHNGSYCDIDWFEDNDYKIVSAKDFIAANKPISKVKFKVGDKVFLPEYKKLVEESEDYALYENIPLNAELTVKSIEANNWLTFEGYNLLHPPSKFKPISELVKKEESKNSIKWTKEDLHNTNVKINSQEELDAFIRLIDELEIEKTSNFKDNFNWTNCYYYIYYEAVGTYTVVTSTEKVIDFSELGLSVTKTKKVDSLDHLFKNGETAIKINVSESEELSRLVQERLFELGYGYGIYKTVAYGIYGITIYNITKTIIGWHHEATYNSSTTSYKEITPQDLGINYKTTKNEEKWTAIEQPLVITVKSSDIYIEEEETPFLIVNHKQKSPELSCSKGVQALEINQKSLKKELLIN